MSNPPADNPQSAFDQRGQPIYGDQTNIAGNVSTNSGLLNTGEITTGGGDVIISDKVIIQRLDPEDIRNQRNHATLRQMIHSFWIEGVLKHSLHNEMLIRLNLENRTNWVDNRPWNLIVHQPDLQAQPVPPGTPILDIFDQMGQRLLILGEPGSGKTTVLLDLANALLNRAAKDPLHPTPVIFNLSSWTVQRKPLADWLVTELNEKYNIPQKLAQLWIDKAEILPLLDGLDEVNDLHRAMCADAINSFRQTHLVPLIVCCRVAEYAGLTSKLKLQGAVLIQPLLIQQVREYLAAAGDGFHMLAELLEHDPILQELSQQPLMLSVMTYAYKNKSARELQTSTSVEAQRQHLFNAYIDRMLFHPNRIQTGIYPHHLTLRWLTWLAKQLSAKRETIFVVEQINSEWLPIPAQRYLHTWSSSMVSLAMFVTGLSQSILSPGLMNHLIAQLSMPQLRQSLKWSWSRALEGVLLGSFIAFWILLSLTSMSLAAMNDEFKIVFSSGSMTRISPLIVVLSGLYGGLLNGFKYVDANFISTKIHHSVLRQSVRNSMYAGAIATCVSIGLLSLFTSKVYDLSGNLFLSLGIGIGFTLLFGGYTYLLYYLVRLILWQAGYIPGNYSRFLDYCINLIFLHRVGNGYIFIHRLLMEHFANLTEEDVVRITAKLDKVDRT